MWNQTGGDCDIKGCTVGEDLGLVDRARKLGKEIAEKKGKEKGCFCCVCVVFICDL